MDYVPLLIIAYNYIFCFAVCAIGFLNWDAECLCPVGRWYDGPVAQGLFWKCFMYLYCCLPQADKRNHVRQRREVRGGV